MSLPTNEGALDLTAIAGLSDSQRHELLTSERRRLTIEVLGDMTLPLTLAEIASAVAASEVDTADPRAATVTDVKRTLHHVHLPKLDDAGVVDYHPTTHRITDHQWDVDLRKN